MQKIVFPTVDVEISLAEIEYEYLKFICQKTLQTSDEILRSQLRSLQLPGVISFTDWRTQSAPTAPATATTSSAKSTVGAISPTEAPQVAKPTRTRRVSSRKQFNAKKLLPEFRGQTLQSAVQIVLAQQPDHAFGTDELLTQIYGEFAEQELTKGRKSLGKSLSNGAKQGLWYRSQEKPPLYRAAGNAS